jgi:tetratricopeptide (TPR) repeat protein
LLVGCARGTDHERMGDRRYAEHAWVDALAEYRLAARQHAPSVELRAKLASAALHAGALADAAAAWRELGNSDPSARTEAADGLMRTARAAIAARDVVALRAAVLGLREMAPGRVPELGSALTLGLEERPVADPDVVLSAAAGAQGTVADSLVAVWAEATARAGHCDVAARAFHALILRSATSGLARSARGGLAGCRVDAGREALSAGNLEEAEVQLRAAVALGVPDSTVRLAWVLIGDVKWAGGDTTVALESYRKALVGAEDDNPMAVRAREQIEKLLGNTPTP